MTTQLPDVTDDDTTTAEAPVTTTEDDVTKLTGTFEYQFLFVATMFNFF